MATENKKIPNESDPLLLEKSAISEDVAVSVDSPTTFSAPRKEGFGYFLMLVSSLFYGFMWIAIRYVTGYKGMSVSTLVFLRGCVQTTAGLFLTFAFLDYKDVFVMPAWLFRMVILRGLLGAAAMTTHFKAISIIPLGVASTLFFTNPIWTIFLSTALLGERIGKREFLATVLSFAGVVLVADPWDTQSSVNPKLYMVGFFLALLAAAIAASAYVTLRSVAPHISFMSSVLSLGVCVTVTGVALGGATVRQLTQDPWTTGIAVFGCFMGFLGQCCLSEAYRYCRAGTGALMRNLDLPLVYLAGVIFLDEIPRILALLGTVFVISGTMILGFEAMKGRK